MIGPTDFLRPSPASHFKTFEVFLMYFPKCPSYSTIKWYNTNVSFYSTILDNIAMLTVRVSTVSWILQWKEANVEIECLTVWLWEVYFRLSTRRTHSPTQDVVIFLRFLQASSHCDAFEIFPDCFLPFIYQFVAHKCRRYALEHLFCGTVWTAWRRGWR